MASEEEGVSASSKMSRKRPRSSSTDLEPAPALSLEVVLSTILVRVADPATLASASLVNRFWYDLVATSQLLDRFRERQPTRLVGFFSEFDGDNGKDFMPLPLPPELRYVSRFLLEAFRDGRRNVQDILSGHILLKLDDSLAVCNPFANMFTTVPLPPHFHYIGPSSGDFYLFNNESIVNVRAILQNNIMHVQLSVYCGTWVQSSTTVELEAVQQEEPLCSPALSVNGYIYMLSVNGFIVKLKIEDCTASVIALPNGSYEWGFQQICRANDSDFLYVHVDGFSIQTWSYMLDKWINIGSVYLPPLFQQHAEAAKMLSSIEWDASRSGWGEFITLYGTTDGAQHIFLGINGIDEDLFLLDIRNEDVLTIGSKISDEKGELIGNTILPLVASWAPLFPRQPAARFSNSTISQFKSHEYLDISCLRSCKFQKSVRRNYQVVLAATRDMGIVKDGLPWKLFDNLAFFKKLTITTSHLERMNAVVMGRKTWESIPLTSRPLPNRLNVVISRSHNSDVGENVVFCESLNSALEVLAATHYSSSIEKVFVIGGAQILRESLNGPACDAIHLFEIHSSIECDTFIPPIDFSVFQPWYSSLPVVENNIRHSFVTFVRVRRSVAESHELEGKKSIEDDTESEKFEIQNFSFLPKMIFDCHEEYQYLNTVDYVIRCGSRKSDSTGKWTLSKFGRQMRFNLRKNFPLLTTKRVFWNGVIEGLLWFISGSTKAKVMQEKDSHTWNHNVPIKYVHSVGIANQEEGDLGQVYSDMHANGEGFDQLMDVIGKIKNNPDDGRIILSAWNPSDLKKMAPSTCHIFAQFYVESGELSCQIYQSSADMGHGVPFNMASYSLLTYTIAHICDLSPGDLVHVIGDAHVYGMHVGAMEEHIQKLPKPFPILEINPLKKDINSFVASDFKLVGYNPHEAIEMEL